LLGGLLRPISQGMRVPEELLEVRNMLATRAETWKQQWLQEGRQAGWQEGRQEGRQEGEQRGRQQGEAALLMRLLERRFGALPAWVQDRIATADTTALEEWGLRVLDAGSLADVLA
jgi:predicted transposase YdaD